MLISFSISLGFFKTKKEIRPLFFLLLLSIITELLVEWMKYRNKEYYFLYHIFTPLEFLLIAYYFLTSSSISFFAFYIKITGFFFILVCLFTLLIKYRLNNFPDITTYLEGFLIITYSVLGLLILPGQKNKSVFVVSSFWIYLSFLVYFSIIFIPLFFHADGKAHIESVFQVISRIGNWSLYILLSIGFLCLKKT